MVAARGLADGPIACRQSRAHGNTADGEALGAAPMRRTAGAQTPKKAAWADLAAGAVVVSNADDEKDAAKDAKGGARHRRRRVDAVTLLCLGRRRRGQRRFWRWWEARAGRER